MRCSGVSPAALLSPLVNPIRISLTSGEGDLRVPSLMRSLVVGDGPSAARGGGVGLVVKRGSTVEGLAVEYVVSRDGTCHELSPAWSRMSMAICGGSFRFE